MKRLILLLFFIQSVHAQAQQKSVTRIWESAALAVPESVLPHPEQKVLYVSLIDGGAWSSDGKGGIAKLNLQGRIIDSAWITGLHAPKGLALFGDKLYVADMSEVVEIDIKASKISRKIAIDSAVALNDLTVDNKGVLYVSDSRRGTVHAIENGKASLFLSNIQGTNGLRAINDDLLVISATSVLKVNKKKEISTILEGMATGGDGIEPVGKEGYIVSCWPGIVYYAKSNGELQVLLDLREHKINTADIGFSPKENILYIPTFNHKTVIAYKLN